MHLAVPAYGLAAQARLLAAGTHHRLAQADAFTITTRPGYGLADWVWPGQATNPEAYLHRVDNTVARP